MLLANLNRCEAAQNLLFQSLAEIGVGLAVVTEPYRVPVMALGSPCGSVILLRREVPGTPSLSHVGGGAGYTAGVWGEVTVVGCYITPNCDLMTFERFLGEVGGLVLRAPTREIMVLGDFNSWSKDWGSRRTNARGRMLAAWAEGLGLRLLNRGNRPTCVRATGSSVVDVTFATPGVAHRVTGWRVMEEETLSDHRYVLVPMSLFPDATRRPAHGSGAPPKWALRRLEPGRLGAALQAVGWAECPADRKSVV